MIEIAYSQHSGKLNRSQQDALWNGIACIQSVNSATASYTTEGDRLLTAVADGVAISPFPHLASRFVIEALAELGNDVELSVKQVREIQGKLCDRYAKGKTLGSSTTLVAATCCNAICHIVNVGDSRAYMITASGNWTQLSHDHTILNDLIETGEADPEIEYAQMYGGLAHCLIADNEEDVFSAHHSSAPFLAGASLLLCSDGLHDTLGDTALRQLYSPDNSPQEQVAVWRKAVLQAGAPDNFSIILARMK